jgi:acetoin utilization protein AcuC
LDERKAAFMYSTKLEEFPYPEQHPFNTYRAKKTREIANSMGLLEGENIKEAPPEPAERILLKKFHTARYIKALKTASQGGWDMEAINMGIGTGDCPVFVGLYEHAVMACGATITGAKLLLTGSADIAFNPSGGFHHAMPERASGFCYINDVALGCILLAEAGKKVLYLDVDVHNGDGVAAAFYNRADVMTISLHENPRLLFPGTGFEDEIGEDEGKGYCVNVPLPIGTFDEAYIMAFNEIAVPLIDAFKPDVIVFELGADALATDPLAHLCLTNNVYVEIIKHLLSLKKPILATGGGGYNVENTVRAWALAWSVFAGADLEHDLSLGVGGVLLESTDWHGGLRDRALKVSKQQQNSVIPVLESTIKTVKENIFSYHGL